MDKTTKLVFKKGNYVILLAGIGIILLGFVVMTMEKAPYGFGFLGLTAGPIIVFSGFMIQFFAIFYKSKKKNDNH